MENHYQKYLPLLEKGKMLMFRDKYGECNLIGGQGKDEGGNYKCSYWCNNFKKCLGCLEVFIGYTEKEFNRLYEIKKWEFCGVCVIGKQCDKCGKIIGMDDEFCVHCGHIEGGAQDAMDDDKGCPDEDKI